jgi:hypothetical protein
VNLEKVIVGRLLAKALPAPARYRLHQCLTATPGTRLGTGNDPPPGRTGPGSGSR